MDPDMHDVGHHPQLAAAPSAVEAVIEAAAAHAERGGDLNLSSAFVAGSGSADVRTLALPLGGAWRFHCALFSGSSPRNQTSGGGAVISCAGVVYHKAVE
jgi:hypothetical protein